MPTSTRSNPWETPAIRVFPRCKESPCSLSVTSSPDFELTACVSLEKGKEFETINHKTYEGSGRSCSRGPKDFTFVCPTEIAAFGKLNDEFADRDAQVLGFSGDSEFVHHAWRKDHDDLRDLPFPMMADSQARADARARHRGRGRLRQARRVHRGPEQRDPVLHGDRRLRRP
ncbi:hypothetical protein GCM10023238_34490 [Streptomyces heliomycini]